MSNPKSVRTSYERPLDSPIGGNHVIEIARPDRHFELAVDGHTVPYIRLELRDPAVILDANKLADEEKWADADRARHARTLVEAVERGEPIYALVLDNRFLVEAATESEINRWSWFLANAMAVSAGYTSHGENSRRRNPHGVSRK